MKDMYTALAALVGIIIGAYLNYLFTKKAEAKRSSDGLRTQAYLDFMKNVVDNAKVEKNPRIDVTEQEKQLYDLGVQQLDARARICLYGTPGVIQSMARLRKETNGSLNSPGDVALFLRVICEMRRSCAAASIWHSGVDRLRRFCRKPPLLAEEMEWLFLTGYGKD